VDDDRPTHLVAEPGDQKAMCGRQWKGKGRRGPAMPYLWVEAVALHTHRITICPDCRDALKDRFGREGYG
jgi:hypothetical protein